MKNLVILLMLVNIPIFAQTYVDKPYTQDYADKFELSNKLEDTELYQVECDRNDVVNIISSNGIIQPFEKQLVPYLQYRPLTDMQILAVTNYKGQFVYLTEKAVLSNAWAGKFYFEHHIKDAKKFAMANDFIILVTSDKELALFKDDKKVWGKKVNFNSVENIVFDHKKNLFLILTNDAVYKLDINSKELANIYKGDDFNSMAIHDNKIVIGTTDGIVILNNESYSFIASNKKLPSTEITSLKNINGDLWFGTTNGAFKLRADLSAEQAGGKYDYYASKRWLVDDEVVDIAKGPDNSVLVLTKTGLSKINFVKMTLADKADYFQKIQRLRHIRYGMTGELTLTIPGNVSSGILADTDNEGLWTSLYLASELFRYAVTKSDDAKQNAYEAFEAMERLTEITGLNGFPARTYERDGYEMGMETNGFSEEWRQEYIKKHGRIWRLSADGRWRWKSNTSSDESAGHFFAYALMAELAPDKEWRDRAIHQIKIEADHLIENNWQLTDWNGEPTAWGRFNPEYVNSYPVIFGDRRLNSTLILAFLQSAYHFTGDKKYKKKAYELINKYGYDKNASSPAIPKGVTENDLQKYDLSWNHSDDQMYFLTAPAFVNYSFTEKQKKEHFEAVKSHWEFKRPEKRPIWNFIYAMVGGTDYSLDESVWWLKEFPMDLVLWNIDNSKRKDLEKLGPNLRGQTYTEVLPPDEVPVHLFNGAYNNNSKANAAREDPPYLFLLPYWLGRYINTISPPVTK